LDSVALVRDALFFGAQLRLPDRRDGTPVVADRAMLNPPEPEPKRLHRDAGNPQRREEMASPAAHHDVATEPVRAEQHRKRLEQNG
jgi:hypothetical protein